MGTQRTSNKDIADKLDVLITLLTNQAQAATVKASPQIAAAIPASQPKAADTGTEPSFEPKYVARMQQVVSDAVKRDGKSRVLYARRNLNNEFKLAYALKQDWIDGTVKDRQKLGVVEVFDA